MANTVQIKRGNNTSVNAHTGPSGEIIYNLDTGRLHAQDGATAGGKPHALISDVDLKASADVNIIAGDGLTGGGTLAANRTLALSSASIASLAKADTAVQSVNGKSGAAVVLVKGDVGLSNVDNTSDASKPISTATQTALNAKANSSVTVSAGSGLTGGGNLTANRSIALNAASIASLGKADTALQAPGGTAGQVLVKSSNTTNDVGWVSSEAATAVSYAPQTLTPAQQVQARQNIQADKSYDSVASVAAATVPAFANAIRTNGYYAAGDGGEALYKRVAVEPSHAGKVQSADGAWWELSNEVVNVRMFGAKGDGISVDTLPFQRAVDFCLRLGSKNGQLHLLKGNYFIDNTITVNLANKVDVFTSVQSLNIVGEGSAVSLITFVPPTDRYCFNILGALEGDAHTMNTNWGGFRIVGRASNPASGISVSIGSSGRFYDIYTLRLLGASHWRCVDGHSHLFDKCLMQTGVIGFSASREIASYPNAHTFIGCTVLSMSLYGIHLQQGCALVYLGGEIARCGAMGTGGIGVFLDDPGREGGFAGKFVGTYFEGNMGLADIRVNVAVGSPVVLDVSGSMFQRISPSEYTTNHISVWGPPGAAALKVIATGAAFKSFNGYVPSIDRAVYQDNTPGDTEYIDDGALYENPLERPVEYSTAPFALVTFDGTDGSISRSKNVAGISRLAAGRYEISFKRGARLPLVFNASANGDFVIAKQSEGVGGIVFTTSFNNVPTDASQITAMVFE